MPRRGRRTLARALLDVFQRLIGAGGEIALILAFACMRLARNAGRIGNGLHAAAAIAGLAGVDPAAAWYATGRDVRAARRAEEGDRLLRYLSLLTPLGGQWMAGAVRFGLRRTSVASGRASTGWRMDSLS